MVCVCVCDFHDSVWMCQRQGGLSRSARVSIARLITFVFPSFHSDGGTAHLCTHKMYLGVTIDTSRCACVCLLVSSGGVCSTSTPLTKRVKSSE